MLTSRIIKIIVENISGIDDLSIKSRKRYIVDNRFVYFKLCHMYQEILGESLSKIGQTVDKDHTTVLHGVGKFNDIHNYASFEGYDTYIKALDNISKIIGSIKGVDDLINEYDIKMYYRLKHLRIIEKSHSIISNMQRKIDLLTKNALVKRIQTLNAAELYELEDRLDVFFKVKAKLRQKEHS